MYAIVEIAGKQFRVSKDMKLRVPRLEGEAGKKVGFDRILLVDDGNGKTKIGNPIVKNMLVNATVISHERDKKVIVFKKKRRKGYQKKQGHRQGYSIIEINTIGSGTLKQETKTAKDETKKSVSTPEKEKAPEKKAAEKKTTTKTTTKKAAAKSGSTAAAKKKETSAKKAAPKKAPVKKETKPAAAKKPAGKADKKED